jgi:pyrimidine dimer DNA glycosylase
MQTFLPFPEFYKCAMFLDKRRCWQQAREAKAIISILGFEKPEWGIEGLKKRGYMNHPAVRQWRGYTDSIKLYFNIILDQCLIVHKIKTMYQHKEVGGLIEHPPWLGYEPLHASHRGRLLAKAPDFYGKYGWKEDVSEYIWPVDENGKLLPEIEKWRGEENV